MGSYLFNGTGTFPDPTQTRYLDREEVGISGDAHPIYPAARKFEMTWDYLSMPDFQTIQGLYDTIRSTGTFVATIPQFGKPWTFISVTGCTLKEPTTSYFFETNVSNVTLLILNVVQ